MLSRSLRSQLIAWMLLVAQLSSLMIVPLHAVAHARMGAVAIASQATDLSAAAVAAPASSSAQDFFSSLFGHDQGNGCDDWSAAFALDTTATHAVAAFTAVVPNAAPVPGNLPVALHACSPRTFLARAPPRR